MKRTPLFDDVVHINENGMECDCRGKFNWDYEDMSIPFEELALPRNAKEFNRRYRRYLIECKLPLDAYDYEQLEEDDE